MPKHGEVFKGKVICEDCKNEFTWVYQYTQNGNEYKVFRVYSLRENEEFLNYLGNNKSSCYCPKCGYKNFYEVVPY